MAKFRIIMCSGINTTKINPTNYISTRIVPLDAKGKDIIAMSIPFVFFETNNNHRDIYQQLLNVIEIGNNLHSIRIEGELIKGVIKLN